jgi:hypothetical protein
MRRGRLTGGIATLGLAAVLAAPAGAATPAQVYKDFATHGKLTQNYSPAVLRATLRDAAVEGYGNPIVVVTLKPVIQQRLTQPKTTGVLGAHKTATRAPLAAATAQRGTLPFTGLQLTLLVLVGGALLASGLLLRFTARGRS